MFQVHLRRLKVTCLGRLWNCTVLSGILDRNAAFDTIANFILPNSLSTSHYQLEFVPLPPLCPGSHPTILIGAIYQC
jgi:hypothetical protein